MPDPAMWPRYDPVTEGLSHENVTPPFIAIPMLVYFKIAKKSAINDEKYDGIVNNTKK